MNAPAVGGGQVGLPFIQNIAPRFVLLTFLSFYNVFSETVFFGQNIITSYIGEGQVAPPFIQNIAPCFVLPKCVPHFLAFQNKILSHLAPV